MHDALLHRGPDSEGFFRDDSVQLASRRLKIIDLDGSEQPLQNETGSVIAVFNGEIYNFTRLRSLLLQHGHCFSTKGDAEVLVHGYEQWGIDGLLERLDGMYAFALYNREKRVLLLARDRFGEKPLYYWHHGKTLFFA
jgi:asparagine synthase (glutamine-hydrolysing)